MVLSDMRIPHNTRHKVEDKLIMTLGSVSKFLVTKYLATALLPIGFTKDCCINSKNRAKNGKPINKTMAIISNIINLFDFEVSRRNKAVTKSFDMDSILAIGIIGPSSKTSVEEVYIYPIGSQRNVKTAPVNKTAMPARTIEIMDNTVIVFFIILSPFM